MKKSKTVTIVALLAIAIVIPQALAATDLGLFYRVEDGNRFYFTMDIEEGGDTLLDELIYVEITDTSMPIPNALSNLTDLVDLNKDFAFENGSSIGMLEDMFEMYAPQFEYPVGNWSLITNLAVTDIPAQIPVPLNSFTINQNADIWGYSYAYDETSDIEATVWVDYSKFDGMLYYLDVEFRNTTTTQLVSEIEAIRYSYHNMEWGCHGGEEFNFHLALTGDNFGFQDLEENFYLKVDDEGIPVIPTTLTAWDDLPHVFADQYWMNDTEFYDSIFAYTWRIAVPIGNWSLLDDFIDDLVVPTDVTLDDTDPWFWGYSWSDMVSGDIQVETHTDYLKVDGVVARHSALFTNTTSSTVVGTISIERLNLLPYTDRTTPEITNPDDVEFAVGSVGHNITWTPTDDNPEMYEIFVNGSSVDTGVWTNGTSIVLDLDDFEVGVYNCTIVVYDIANNKIIDTVIVTVTEPGGGISGIVITSIIIGAGVLALIGAALLLRKRS